MKRPILLPTGSEGKSAMSIAESLLPGRLDTNRVQAPDLYGPSADEGSL